MQRKAFKTAPILSQLQDIAIAIQSSTPADMLAVFDSIASRDCFQSKGWRVNLAKLRAVLETGRPEFSIYAMGGNSKLPFVAFSSLPGVTCPGAGECIDFCYSFRAWRYPAAFCRQAQNAYLMRFGRDTLRTAFRSIADNRADGFDFRLYVDGDFSSVSDVQFWMETLRENPAARAYGYSKSFAQLLEYGAREAWPENYMLNLSSGHNASAAVLELARMLPIARGEFRAVSIGRTVKGSDHGKPETNRAIRDALPGVKVFPCPGKCGTCTGAGHACGLPQLRGRVIAIAIH